MIQIVRYPEEIKDLMKETESSRTCPLCNKRAKGFGYTHPGFEVQRVNFFARQYIKWVYLDCIDCGCGWRYAAYRFIKDFRKPRAWFSKKISKLDM